MADNPQTKGFTPYAGQLVKDGINQGRRSGFVEVVGNFVCDNDIGGEGVKGISFNIIDTVVKRYVVE